MPRSQEHLHVSMRSITAQPLGRVDNEQHQQCTENTTEVLRFMVSCQNKFQKMFELVVLFFNHPFWNMAWRRAHCFTISRRFGILESPCKKSLNPNVCCSNPQKNPHLSESKLSRFDHICLSSQHIKKILKHHNIYERSNGGLYIIYDVICFNISLISIFHQIKSPIHPVLLLTDCSIYWVFFLVTSCHFRYYVAQVPMQSVRQQGRVTRGPACSSEPQRIGPFSMAMLNNQGVYEYSIDTSRGATPIFKSPILF